MAVVRASLPPGLHAELPADGPSLPFVPVRRAHVSHGTSTAGVIPQVNDDGVVSSSQDDGPYQLAEFDTMAVPQSIAWRLTNSAPHDDDACGGQPGGVFGHLAAVADVAIRPATTSVSGNRHAMRNGGAANLGKCSNLGGSISRSRARIWQRLRREAP